MAIKFNSLTFDLKDLILIMGIVAGYFNFKSEQKEMYNELKSEITYKISMEDWNNNTTKVDSITI